MRKIFGILMMLSITLSFAQNERVLELNKETNLIEVTYFHDNGVISQTGAYTTDGKLQGEWISFNLAGEKIVAAKYNKGAKVGKWFYWNDNTLKEVDYSDNNIARVNEWTSKASLAQRD